MIPIFPLTLGFTSIANSVTDESWYLMSRYGECLEIKSLQRKIPDMGDIKSPIEFSTFMKKKGYKVKSFTVQFPSRAHGVSKWAYSTIMRRRTIYSFFKDVMRIKLGKLR